MRTMSQAVLPPVFLVALVAPSLRAQDAADDAGAARVIVRFRADSSLARSNGLSPQGAVAARAEALGARLGLALRAGAAVSGLAQVVFASGVTSAELAERLALESDVEYAVPDERRRIVGAPNDPLYAAGVGGSGPRRASGTCARPRGRSPSSLERRGGLGGHDRESRTSSSRPSTRACATSTRTCSRSAPAATCCPGTT